MIDIDLRDNIDCVPAGFNESRTCAISSVIIGVFNQLPRPVPHNEGSFRRIRVHLRENCVAGIPRHPTCCSVATTNVADRLINITQAAFADLGEGYGLAEGAVGSGPGFGVISGADSRRGDADYINQVYFASSGGPAAPSEDGWLFYGIPVCAGLMYRDSIEVAEQKYPILIDEVRLQADSEGAGRYRGAPGSRIAFGPTDRPMTVAYVIDGHYDPPRGVLGGGDAAAARRGQARRRRDGGGGPDGRRGRAVAGRDDRLRDERRGRLRAARASASPSACAGTSRPATSRRSAQETSTASRCGRARTARTRSTPPPPRGCGSRPRRREHD